eukprot:8846630-Pyramimonas_sp.AAC.1
MFVSVASAAEAPGCRARAAACASLVILRRSKGRHQSKTLRDASAAAPMHQSCIDLAYSGS